MTVFLQEPRDVGVVIDFCRACLHCLQHNHLHLPRLFARRHQEQQRFQQRIINTGRKGCDYKMALTEFCEALVINIPCGRFEKKMLVSLGISQRNRSDTGIIITTLFSPSHYTTLL